MSEYDFLAYLIQTAPMAALFFFLWKNGIISFSGQKKDDVPHWARHLEQYFNHDITEKLDGLSRTQDLILKDTGKTNTTLEEWQRYGVPQKKP